MGDIPKPPPKPPPKTSQDNTKECPEARSPTSRYQATGHRPDTWRCARHLASRMTLCAQDDISCLTKSRVLTCYLALNEVSASHLTRIVRISASGCSEGLIGLPRCQLSYPQWLLSAPLYLRGPRLVHRNFIQPSTLFFLLNTQICSLEHTPVLAFNFKMVFCSERISLSSPTPVAVHDPG